jgi:hypothetical protein
MFKIYRLKEYVYRTTDTKNTKELKEKNSDLVAGRDLRKKYNWLSIYNTLKAIEDFQEEQLDKDIETIYGYKRLDKNCSVTELLDNIGATRKFIENFEQKFNSI